MSNLILARVQPGPEICICLIKIWCSCFPHQVEYARFTRDPGRGPIQWNDSINAGFSSSAKTWLPVHPEYNKRNVAVRVVSIPKECWQLALKRLVDLD